ncbi:MAG: 50S ribosomal protein L11 methyltransferase [Thermoclostridium sp.]|nr:50S ribosomal protein L11 methyltransferase [Thermoclostridium sp.]
MQWLEVSVEVEPEEQEILSQIMMDQGVTGLEIVDPQAFRQVLEENRYLDYADDGFLDSYGNKTIVKAYFQAERDVEKLKAELKNAFSLLEKQPSEIKIKLRDDSEWKDSWKKHYKTFYISKRVIIKPSWEDFMDSEGKTIIELDPGMAFGTGTHETTKMCAVLLDDLIRGNEQVLDLGCGTGILGIIAAKLGARQVTCVDIDDAACKTAQENIEKNHVEKNVSVLQGELTNLPHKQYDIVIINIIADVILALLPGLKQYIGSHSAVLLSGIIRERKQEVFSAAIQQGYRVIREINEGEWVALQLCIDF